MILGWQIAGEVERLIEFLFAKIIIIIISNRRNAFSAHLKLQN